MDGLDQEYIQLTPELYQKCLDFMSQRKLSERTKDLYTKELDRIFNYPQLTQAQYSRIYSKGNFNLAILKLILDTCKHNDIPIYNYKAIKPVRKRRPIPQTWSENQILRLAEEIEDYGLLVLCSYYIGAGLRFSSAIMLSWEDFDWEDWVKDKSKNGKVFIRAKGKKEAKLIVDRILMQKLHDIAARDGKLFLDIPYKNRVEDKYLFIKKVDEEALMTVFRRRNFDKMLENDQNKINVQDRVKNEIVKKKHYLVDYKLKKLNHLFGKKIKFHSIRHSRATNLLRKGVSLVTIQKQLMHSSLTTTQLYLNLIDVDMEQELENKL